LLSGVVFCRDCGCTMVAGRSSLVTKSGEKHAFVYYKCRTHSATGGTACANHTIAEEPLLQIVLAHIRQSAELVRLSEDNMLDMLMAKLVDVRKMDKAEANRERRQLRQRIHKLEGEISHLYESWAAGETTDTAFRSAVDAFEAERVEKEQRLSLLEQTEQEAAERVDDINRWMALIRDKASAQIVDRELLDTLVERIEIGEKLSRKGNEPQDVRIFYKFVGLL